MCGGGARVWAGPAAAWCRSTSRRRRSPGTDPGTQQSHMSAAPTPGPRRRRAEADLRAGVHGRVGERHDAGGRIERRGQQLLRLPWRQRDGGASVQGGVSDGAAGLVGVETCGGQRAWNTAWDATVEKRNRTGTDRGGGCASPAGPAFLAAEWGRGPPRGRRLVPDRILDQRRNFD